MASKEKPRELKQDKPQRPRFVPCGRETGGGAQTPGTGTSCVGGQMFFWASYQGKTERFVKDCACLNAWRAGYTGPMLEGKSAQPALGDTKAKAAGE